MLSDFISLMYRDLIKHLEVNISWWLQTAMSNTTVCMNSTQQHGHVLDYLIMFHVLCFKQGK